MSKTIYLLPENRLPFPPKGSTFSIKKVYLFCRKGRPFLKKVANLSAKILCYLLKWSAKTTNYLQLFNISFYMCML